VLRVRSRFTDRATTPKRRARRAKGALGALGVTGLLIGMVGAGGPAAAEGNCENVTQYSAIAAASGGNLLASADNLTLIGGTQNPAHASMPGSQAQLDSVLGSKGWAGAPYSATVADNAGAGGADSSAVPTFAIAQHPTSPSASKPLPGGGLEAAASADSASGKTTVSGSNSPGAAAASVTTSAKSSCASDATLEAVADLNVTGVDIAGVLKIASVRSHARSVLTPGGERTLEGTIDIEGATVAGTPVSISDKGVAVAGSPSALPADPVTPALEAAGIEVRYLSVAKDASLGQVLAPTLEIVVAGTSPGPSGDVPIKVTLSFGGSYARAVLEGSEGVSDAGDDFGIDDMSSFVDEGVDDFTSTDVAPLDTPVDTPAETSDSSSPSSGSAANVATARLADWSIAPGYSAMGVGALLLLVAWVGLEKFAVRLRWR
jgi:hypothetical protein